MDIQTEHINDIVSWAIGIPSIGVVIAYGISIIRSRISTDIKNSEEEKEYSSMLDSYKEERDSIREERDRTISRMGVIEIERNDAVSKVGKLSAEVKFLSIQVNELKAMVEKLSVNLDQSRREIHALAIENAKLSYQICAVKDCTNFKPLVTPPSDEETS